jgi:hypothetical protein
MLFATSWQACGPTDSGNIESSIASTKKNPPLIFFWLALGVIFTRNLEIEWLEANSVRDYWRQAHPEPSLK